MKLRKQYLRVILAAVVLLITAAVLIWKFFPREPLIVDDPAIANCDIPTPQGWIANCDAPFGNPTPEDATPRSSLADPNHIQLYDFVKNQTSTAAFGGQIIVEAQRMDRPLAEWINAYIGNSAAVEHIPFDPLQTWSAPSGHLLLVAESKPNFALTYYLFNKDIVYIFWFGPFARLAPGGTTYDYNTDSLRVVQTMITNFAAKL